MGILIRSMEPQKRVILSKNLESPSESSNLAANLSVRQRSQAYLESDHEVLAGKKDKCFGLDVSFQTWILLKIVGRTQTSCAGRDTYFVFLRYKSSARKSVGEKNTNRLRLAIEMFGCYSRCANGGVIKFLLLGFPNLSVCYSHFILFIIGDNTCNIY